MDSPNLFILKYQKINRVIFEHQNSKIRQV